MTELIVPVAFGLLGGGLGYVMSQQRKKQRWEALSLSDQLRAQGDPLGAVAVLERELRLPSAEPDVFPTEARTRLASLYTSLGRWREGDDVCSELLEREGALTLSVRHEIRMHRVRCRMALGRTDEAAADRALADTLIEDIPDTAYRLFARQELLMRRGDYKEAQLLQAELLTDYAERLGSLPTLLVMAAATAFNAGYPDEARLRVAEALRHPRSDATVQREAHRVGFRACEALADWEGMYRHARADHDARATEQNPSHRAVARKNLAVAATCLGYLTEALTYTEEDPQSLALVRSDIFCLLGRYDLAGAALATWEAPTEWDGAALRASVALKAGDGATALSFLDALLPSPTLPEKHILRRRARRAHALALAGHREEAELALDELTLSPTIDRTTRWIVLDHTARAYQSLGANTKAIPHFAALLAEPIAPVFRPGLLLALGDCNEKLGDHGAAQRAWSEAARVTVEAVAVSHAKNRLSEIQA